MFNKHSNQNFDSSLQVKLQTTLHKFNNWKNNHYIYLVLFIVLFVITLWLENPLFKLPMLATSFFCAGKFVKEFEIRK